MCFLNILPLTLCSYKFAETSAFSCCFIEIFCLHSVKSSFVQVQIRWPSWPVHKNHFSLVSGWLLILLHFVSHVQSLNLLCLVFFSFVVTITNIGEQGKWKHCPWLPSLVQSFMH